MRYLPFRRVARSVLPDWLIPRMRSMSLLGRINGGPAQCITVGVGEGLRFDPGRSNPAYASGANELPVQAALARHLAPGSVFYDVGANVGFFTVIASRLVGAVGHVYAFEPVPENAAYIELNLRLNNCRNVTVVRKAVAALAGRGELWMAEYAGGGALTTAAVPPDANGRIDVDIVAIDDLVFACGWRPPAVVKIDVEGSEVDVLRGMRRTLREKRPIVVYEVDDACAAGLQQKYQAAEDLLKSLAYHVERLEDSYPHNRWLVSHAIATPA